MTLTQILSKLKSLVYSKTETDTLLGNKAASSHTHTKSEISDFPAYGSTAGTICQGNDSRLSDARTPTSHTHTKSQITDFPTIPTVNNATLKIQKNGTDVKTFTANASTDVTCNITVPTKVSELTNDSGFLTSHQSLSNYLTKTTNVSEMGRYIDMHYDNATMARDYDVRLYVDSQTSSNGGGSFKISAGSVYTPNNLYLGSYRVYVG